MPTSALTQLARPAPRTGSASALGAEARLLLKYGTNALKLRSPLVAHRCGYLIGRERADPAVHRARANELLARTFRAAERIPAHAKVAKKAPPSADLVDYLQREVPLMDKTSLQRHRADFYPNHGTAKPWWLIGESSGSTGSPTDVFRSLDSVFWEEAFHRQHWSWAGWRAHEPQAVLRGDLIASLEQRDPPLWFRDRLGRQLILSTRHLSEHTVGDFAEEVRRFGATQLRAYPSAAFGLAVALGHCRSALRFHSVITGSEMLYPFQRAKIEEAFGARVYSFYGMSERVAFAAECEHGRMHVNPEYSIVEILDEAGRPTDGEGFLVGTTLHNTVMPLLRYRLTDTARWDRRPCPCGRTYPVIERLGGKIEDRVFDLKGRAISSAVVGFAYKGLANIQKGQIAQIAPDRWVARIVPGDRYTRADGERLLENVARYVSADVNVGLELVGDIPSMPSGKYKWVSQEWRPSPAGKAGDGPSPGQ